MTAEGDIERCARDSDWCDGHICRERGIDCPNAEPLDERDRQERREDEEAEDAERKLDAAKVGDYDLDFGSPRGVDQA